MDPSTLPPLPSPTPQGDNSDLNQQPPQSAAQPAAPEPPATPEPAPQQSTEEPSQNFTDAADPASQVVERLKNANNVLVTVSTNPSVDQLASALGLTLVLDKLGKHATTVFSGEIPRAIEFLDPEATFEENVDSLRDFIIALDKEKADKLRYKVEEDVVRIFITPYKTKITEKDLDFSQGDFNVDVVVALGVTKREDLDKAITAHGRILHDATVITVNADGQTSSLGSIDWHSPESGSVAQMLVGVNDQLGSDLLDAQISTAYLTGIVAATNRFSNEKTTPQVMTMAAQLMAAGANQQLIASNLRQDGLLSESVNSPSEDHEKESEVEIEHEEKSPKKHKTNKKKIAEDKKDDSEEENEPPTSETDEPDEPSSGPPVDFPPKTDELEAEAEQETKDQPLSLELPDDIKDQLEAPSSNTEPEEPEGSAAEEASEPETKLGEVKPETNANPEPVLPANEPETATNSEPVFNATMGQITADKNTNQNNPVPQVANTPDSIKPITPSGSIAAQDNFSSPALPSTPSVGGSPVASTSSSDGILPPSSPISTSPPAPADGAVDQTNSDLPVVEDQQAQLEEARKAVEQAADATPFDPAGHPIQALNAQPLPDVEQTSTEAPLPSLEQQNHTMLPSASPPVSDDLEDETPSPEPMDAFMSTHSAPSLNPTENQNSGSLPPLPTSPMPDVGSVPPPMPAQDASSDLPQASEPAGLPPLPGQATDQPSFDPATSFQPQTQPDFMQGQPTSQNPITQAADDLTAKRDQEGQERQAKMDQLTDQYDNAVDKNRELQGLPPLNSPDGSGLPPLPPTPTV